MAAPARLASHFDDAKCSNEADVTLFDDDACPAGSISPTATGNCYDDAGNVTADLNHSYTYDGESRLCALRGPDGMIGYQYDADGNRIGKGTVTNWQSCDLTANGYVPTTDYVLDQGGGQMSEVAVGNGQQTWTHTNVTANGMLIATYDALGAHFYLNDALGSRRVQTDAAGFPEQTCQSLPFGNQLYCTGSLTSGSRVRKRQRCRSLPKSRT